MGVRLYNPLTGRFLQTDPVAGGSANAYDYADQDPVNSFDLDGRMVDPDISRAVRCAKLLSKIIRQKNLVSRRGRQLVENKRMWAHDSEERIGHVQAYQEAQQGLRNLLEDFLACGCGGPGGGGFQLPKGIWKYATRPTPGFNSKHAAEAAAAGAAGAGLLWWLGKLASPACGPGAPVCAIVL